MATATLENTDNPFMGPIQKLKKTWKKILGDLDTRLEAAQAELKSAQKRMDKLLAEAAQSGDNKKVAIARKAVAAAFDTLADLQAAQRGAQTLDTEQKQQTVKKIFKEKALATEKNMAVALKAAKNIDQAISQLAENLEVLRTASGELFDNIPLGVRISKLDNKAGRSRLCGAVLESIAASHPALRRTVPGDTGARLTRSVTDYLNAGCQEIRDQLKAGAPHE